MPYRPSHASCFTRRAPQAAPPMKRGLCLSPQDLGLALGLSHQTSPSGTKGALRPHIPHANSGPPPPWAAWISDTHVCDECARAQVALHPLPHERKASNQMGVYSPRSPPGLKDGKKQNEQTGAATQTSRKRWLEAHQAQESARKSLAVQIRLMVAAMRARLRTAATAFYVQAQRRLCRCTAAYSDEGPTPLPNKTHPCPPPGGRGGSTNAPLSKPHPHPEGCPWARVGDSVPTLSQEATAARHKPAPKEEQRTHRRHSEQPIGGGARPRPPTEWRDPSIKTGKNPCQPIRLASNLSVQSLAPARHRGAVPPTYLSAPVDPSLVPLSLSSVWLFASQRRGFPLRGCLFFERQLPESG